MILAYAVPFQFHFKNANDRQAFDFPKVFPSSSTLKQPSFMLVYRSHPIPSLSRSNLCGSEPVTRKPRSEMSPQFKSGGYGAMQTSGYDGSHLTRGVSARCLALSDLLDCSVVGLLIRFGAAITGRARATARTKARRMARGRNFIAFRVLA